MNNKIYLGLVFLAALAIGAYFVLPSNLQQIEMTDFDTSGVREMVLGDENAPVTLVEYASYTCPHCGAFHNGFYKDIKADYIDTGKVKFIYREVYFDRFGLWASIVARCGDGKKFFEVTDALYANQGTWTKGTPQEITANITNIALSAGLTQDEVSACLSDGENAKALVAWEEQNRTNDRVTSTPSFFVDGSAMRNSRNYADFQSALGG